MAADFWPKSLIPFAVVHVCIADPRRYLLDQDPLALPLSLSLKVDLDCRPGLCHTRAKANFSSKDFSRSLLRLSDNPLLPSQSSGNSVSYLYSAPFRFFLRFLFLFFSLSLSLVISVWRRTALTLAHCHFVVHCCANAVDADSHTHTHTRTPHTHSQVHNETTAALPLRLRSGKFIEHRIALHRVENFLLHRFHLNLSMETVASLLVAGSFLVPLLHCISISILTTRKYIYLWRCNSSRLTLKQNLLEMKPRNLHSQSAIEKVRQKGSSAERMTKNCSIRLWRSSLCFEIRFKMERRLRELNLNTLLYQVLP